MKLLAARPDDGDLLPEQNLYLCPADSIKDLADKTAGSQANFGLFVAMNAIGVEDDSILQGAKKLLSQGLACLCTWGPDCERVHDLFDIAAREINSQLSGDDVIMTSWHSDESMGEALWYFVNAAFVTEKFEKTCKDWIIAPISNLEWEQQIPTTIAQMNTISEDDSDLK
jgi:hypothetical protein